MGRMIPIYNGPRAFTLVVLGFLAPFVLGRWGYLVSVISGVLVLLSWRRFTWGTVAVAIALLLFARTTQKRGYLVAIVVTVVVVSLAVGGPIVQRLQSFSPTSSTPFSQTNSDHVGDILDAWDVVKTHPVFGIGLGMTYQTDRIYLWKKESWGVHNAILHAWLRYGLLGLAGYLLFHYGLFRWLWRQGGWPQVFGAVWTGLFVMGFGFTPWPYGGLQLTSLLFTLLGFAWRYSVTSPSHETPAGVGVHEVSAFTIVNQRIPRFDDRLQGR